MFCEGQNVVFEKVKCVISASLKINLNMQGKTLESSDFLKLQVTNKFEKSTKQNLSLEKSLQNTNKKRSVIFVIEFKNKYL